MFTSVEEIKKLTNRDVDQQTIIMAQAIIEAYVGRVEAEVISSHDKGLLALATAYQSAYMFDDDEQVFEQMAVRQVVQGGSVTTFRTGDTVSPFIAPLAVFACKNLTWNRVRSVRTGSIFARPVVQEDWRTT